MSKWYDTIESIMAEKDVLSVEELAEKYNLPVGNVVQIIDDYDN